MKLTYTDRFFITLTLQTYLDRAEPNPGKREIIRRILRKLLKDEEEFSFSDEERCLMIVALGKYPSIGMCNKLILKASDELTMKLVG